MEVIGIQNYTKIDTIIKKKTIACAKKGIRLIHIFEYEWLDVEKQIKIKNLLKSILGANEVERLYARKLKVVEIDSSEAYKFEDKYHLQGKSNSSINIALKSENEIIGIMTFNKPRFNREYEYELIRLCWKQNTIVIGGAERMFKYFIKNYNAKSIITYTDISKFTGNVYIRLGFKPIQPKPITEPNYVWVSMSGDCILNRYQTQKKKLIERGLGEPNQTEDEIMRSKDFLKVYDSGNIKLEYRKETSNGNK